MWMAILLIILLLVCPTALHSSNAVVTFDALIRNRGTPTLTDQQTCIFPPLQLQALQDLYDSTNGETWRWKLVSGAQWNFSEPNPNPCAEQWAGITCSSDIINVPCNVTKLNLNDFGLKGRFPTTLNLLSTLVEMDLSTNFIFGAIPPTMTELTNLNVLSLAGNFFNSTIPATIGQMKSLIVLDLTSNLLQGDFPLSMSELSRLQYLNLSANNITDHVPPYFGNLSTLEVIDLSINNLYGPIPETLSNLKRLLTLRLNKNRLDGTIPEELGKFRAIQSIDLTNNTLVGTLPQSFENLTTLLDFSVGNNRLVGHIHDSLIRNWKRLRTLNLNSNRFNGSIPESIVTLVDMVELSFSANYLTGPIPSNITNLQSLQFLYLSNNYFTGTLPTHMEKFTKMKIFEFYHNRFIGTIPMGIGNMSDVEVIDFGTNFLNGTIPSSICNLPKIRFLLLNRNFFTGAIPDCIGNLEYLIELLLQNNQLSSSLPDSILKLNRLHYLYVYGNKLTGQLPVNFGENYEKMTQLDMHDNLFSGTIPSSACHMFTIYYLYFSQNMFHGTIPNCLGNAVNMYQLFLQENLFSGTLPVSFSNFTQINALIVNENMFSGAIDPGIFSMGKHLLGFVLCDNFFTGTIPDEIASLSRVVTLNMSNNSFSGSLPKGMSNMSQLVSLDLSNNMFSGSIARDVLSPLTLLKILFLENNEFTGPMHKIFNTSYQKQLTDIDISGNFFTGTIPRDLFNVSRHIVTFAAVKNCITGSIPEEICHSHFLRSLALDGLHSATRCQDRIFPLVKSIDTYQLTKDLSGSIPSCLYNMPFLRTLHLSGNGIKGSLPSSLVLGKQLTDLSLSHNLIKGTIPNVIQQRSFENLDLSFNQISGSLSDTFASYPLTNSSLALQVNRLSGAIPTSILDMFNISILQGNIFSCINGESSLPQHDQYTSSYECGSDSVNAAIYLWIVGFLALTTTVVLYFLYIRNYVYERFDKLLDYIGAWWSVYDDPKILYSSSHSTSSSTSNPSALALRLRSSTMVTATERNTVENSAARGTQVGARGSIMIQAVQVLRSSLFNTSGLNMTAKSKTKDGKINYIFRFGLLLGRMRKIAAHVIGILLIAIMPIFIVLSKFFSMYSFPYAWQVGLAFVSGITPAIVLLVIFVLFYCRIYYFLKIWLLDSYVEEVLVGRLKVEKRAPLTKSTNIPSLSALLVRKWHEMRTNSTVVDGANGITNRLRKEQEKEPQSDKQQEEKEKGEEEGGSSKSKSKSATSQDSDGTFKRDLLKQQQVQQDIASAQPWFYLRELLILLFNCVIVLAVNMSYVYATTLSINKDALLFFVFVVSLFKIFWGNLMVVQVFSKILLQPYQERHYHQGKNGGGVAGGTSVNKIHSDSTTNTNGSQNFLIDTQQEVLDHFTASCLRFLVYLSIFNNVIAPSIAAMIISPNCFFYMLVDSPPVTVSYQFLHCVEFYSTTVANSCEEFAYNTHTTSYSPPYTYSYQCSSALITSFSDIFIYRYFVSGLFIPLVLIILKYTQERCYRYYYDKNPVYRHLFKLISSVLPLIARPVSNSPLMPGSSLSSDYDDAYSGVSDEEKANSPGNSGKNHNQDIYAVPNPLLMSFGNNTASMILPPNNHGGEQSMGNGSMAQHQWTFSPSVVNYQYPPPAPSMSATIADSEDRDTIPRYHDVSTQRQPFTPDPRGTNVVSLRQPDNSDSVDSSGPGVAGNSPTIRGTMNKDMAEYRKTILIDRLLVDKQMRKKLFNKEIFTVGFVGDMAVLMTFGAIFPPLALVIFLNLIVNTFLTQLMIGRFIYLSKSLNQRYLLPLVEFLNDECKDVGRLIFDSIPTIAFLATAFWSFALFDTLGDSVGTRKAIWILILVTLLPMWIYGIEKAYYYAKEAYFYVIMDAHHSLGSSMFRASGFTDNSSTRQSIFSKPSFLTSFGRKSVTVKTSSVHQPRDDESESDETSSKRTSRKSVKIEMRASSYRKSIVTFTDPTNDESENKKDEDQSDDES